MRFWEIGAIALALSVASGPTYADSHVPIDPACLNSDGTEPDGVEECNRWYSGRYNIHMVTERYYEEPGTQTEMAGTRKAITDLRFGDLPYGVAMVGIYAQLDAAAIVLEELAEAITTGDNEAARVLILQMQHLIERAAGRRSGMP